LAAEFSGLTVLVMMMIILIYAMHEFAEHWIPRNLRKRFALQLLTMGLAIFGDAYAVVSGSTLSGMMAVITLLVMLGELAVHRSLASFVALARLVIPPQYPVLAVSLLLSSLTEGSLRYLEHRKKSVEQVSSEKRSSEQAKMAAYEEYMGE